MVETTSSSPVLLSIIRGSNCVVCSGFVPHLTRGCVQVSTHQALLWLLENTALPLDSSCLCQLSGVRSGRGDPCMVCCGAMAMPPHLPLKYGQAKPQAEGGDFHRSSDGSLAGQRFFSPFFLVVFVLGHFFCFQAMKNHSRGSPGRLWLFTRSWQPSEPWATLMLS